MTVTGNWVWAPKNKGTLQKEGLRGDEDTSPPTNCGRHVLSYGYLQGQARRCRGAPWFAETLVNHLKRVEQRTWQGQVCILDKSHWPVYFSEGAKVKVQKQLLNGHTNGIRISWCIRLAPVNYKLSCHFTSMMTDSQMLLQLLTFNTPWGNNEKTEREVKETIPFTIATKRIKYFWVYLPKETKDLYIENYQTLMKETKEDTNRWRNIACSWIGRINIVKMAILPQSNL